MERGRVAFALPLVGAETCDLDGDGLLEVVLASNSPGNFPADKKLEDGTDDSHAYLYVLSSQGGLEWRRELGGVFTTIYPLSQGPTNRTVMVWVTSGHAHTALRDEPDVGRILAFNADGTLIRSNDLRAQLTSALAVDLNRDGSQEVLAADYRGVLHVLNNQLEEKASFLITSNRYSEVDLRICDASSRDDSGSPLLALASSQVERRGDPEIGNTREKFETLLYHNNRVIVLDAGLRVLASHLVAEKWNHPPGLNAKFLKAGSNSAPELVVLSDRVTVLALTKPDYFARVAAPAEIPAAVPKTKSE